MNSWIILFFAVIFEVVGTSALKYSEGFSKLLPSLVVVVSFAIAFYLLSLTLRTIPVGIVYAVWSGLGIIFISLIGWVIFGQKLDMAAIGGILLIGAGIVVMNVFSDSGAH